MEKIRPAAVAGSFYPDDAQQLQGVVEGYLAEIEPYTEPLPKAIIAPHAGYIYSGPIAASAYAPLRSVADSISRVVLLGPSHRVGFNGLATTNAESYRTPLGDIPIDREAFGQIEYLRQVHSLDEAHQFEHSLEVQLPFLQQVLHSFELVPIVVGNASGAEVAEVLERLWGGTETIVVISSDLSHYLSYSEAQQIDEKTSRAIVQLRPEELQRECACGRIPIKGLLEVAQRKGLRAEMVDLRNSGDTAGSHDRVVGYGSYFFH